MRVVAKMVGGLFLMSKVPLYLPWEGTCPASPRERNLRPRTLGRAWASSGQTPPPRGARCGSASVDRREEQDAALPQSMLHPQFSEPSRVVGFKVQISQLQYASQNPATQVKESGEAMVARVYATLAQSSSDKKQRFQASPCFFITGRFSPVHCTMHPRLNSDF